MPCELLAGDEEDRDSHSPNGLIPKTNGQFGMAPKRFRAELAEAVLVRLGTKSGPASRRQMAAEDEV